jgi:hypothetical protein
MGNGEWGNGHGAMGMGHGAWGMGKEEKPNADLDDARLCPMPDFAQCPITNYQLPITHYPLIDRLVICL